MAITMSRLAVWSWENCFTAVERCVCGLMVVSLVWLLLCHVLLCGPGKVVLLYSVAVCNLRVVTLGITITISLLAVWSWENCFTEVLRYMWP